MATNETSKEQDLWNRILEDLRNRGEVGEYAFDAFFSKLTLIADTGEALRVEYPAGMMTDWYIMAYSEQLANAAAHALGEPRTMDFVEAGGGEKPASDTQEKEEPQEAAPAPAKAKKRSSRPRRSSTPFNSGLSEDFSFDSFVVGADNEFAVSAARAVANATDSAYNPLFLYGGSGLGKSHLLQAIGNAIRQRDEDARVLYVTGEDFTNSYIEAVSTRGNSLREFRQKFRRADVLLIDDIQFLARGEKTQEEFFHTFNTLISRGKRIVLTADCPASDITRLDARLTSRFEQGLAVDLRPPCLETRLAILRSKRSNWKSDLISDEVLDYLARNITRSVRRMEGALTRLATFASFSRHRPTVTEAKNQLKDLLHEDRGTQVTIEDIQRRIADAFHVRVADLVGRRRTADIAKSRHVAMYLARKHTDLSLQDIGEAFGGRDHGTVIHATRKVERKIEEDSSLRSLIEEVSAALA